MLGKDIAQNLREHKEMWTDVFFIRRVHHDGRSPKYCVLGLKAHEAGISDDILAIANDRLSSNKFDTTSKAGENQDLADVWIINDNARTVENAIAEFDSLSNHDRDFPGVERFIQLCRDLKEE